MVDVRFENVVKEFDGVQVVKGINFYIKYGELFILFGLSGCGKIIILRMIVGLDYLMSGKIYFGD